MRPDYFAHFFQGFCIESQESLSTQQIEDMIILLSQKVAPNIDLLSGRRSALFGQIGGLGPVVAKQYARGGVFASIFGSRFIRFGLSRPRNESQWLQRVSELGVRVPIPLACITRGRYVYQAWLVMKEIPDQKSLAQLAIDGDSNLEQYISETVRFVRILIENDILHVDLHPGNVLIDSSSKVYLIDFDKAAMPKSMRVNLRDYYLRRWRRAIIKHNLPEYLSESFSAGLRRSFGR